MRSAAEQLLRTSQLEGQLLEQLFGSAVTEQRPPQAYGVQPTQGIRVCVGSLLRAEWGCGCSEEAKGWAVLETARMPWMLVWVPCEGQA